MAPSAVWVHMKRISASEVQCSRCKKVQQHKKGGGTSTLRTHLQKIHNICVPTLPAPKRRRENAINDDLEDEDGNLEDIESANQNDVTGSGSGGLGSPEIARRPASAPPPAGGGRQSTSRPIFSGPLDRCINNMSAYAPNGARDKECTDVVLFMISRDSMSLSTTERKGFRVFVRTLNPQYKLPSEPTVTKLLNEKYKILKERVTSELEQASCIVLTTDIWTQRNTMKSFLGITAHYPVGALMVSVEIGAIHLREKKTIPYLRKVLRDTCSDWHIKNESVKAF